MYEKLSQRLKSKKQYKNHRYLKVNTNFFLITLLKLEDNKKYTFIYFSKILLLKNKIN